MPASSSGTPAPRQSPIGLLTDHLELGVLAARYPPRDLIEECLISTHSSEQRSRALPAHVMVRHTIAQALYCADSASEVMTRLAGSLTYLGSWESAWRVPTSSAIVQARQRLGLEPLIELFERACPCPGLTHARAWWRVCA
ncbi:hypothetical protein H4W79_000398 [Nocardiopsis terrae]|uniref:Transposase IS4 N-terminal domain-containing protein n=1 Tax=Nocardiopsis terrae TaxID=372655 RepID=A0ABR9HAY6_9ACTN|nr:transposase domain-containing protein [Nocardiopsis terrae]MBE1456184.1 hypothetical protein [Nocardiopsis terrae]